MKKRITTVKVNKLILLSIILLFCLIIGKLIYVNISKNVDGMDLKAFAEQRNTTKKTLYAKRGTIYDKSGEILAQNVNSYTVIAFLNPKRTEDKNNPKHVVDVQMTAEKLAPILKMEVGYLVNLLTVENQYQVELGPGGRNISELTKKEIEALDLPGIAFVTSQKRYYKMGTFAPYIIGYAKKDDTGEIIGEMGIESYYNDTLKGKDGFTEYQRDLYGYQIPNTTPIVENPTSGSDIYLTIDNNIQLMVENAIADLVKDYKMNWIQITVADAKTGAILASGSNPTFNLNTLDNIENYINPLIGYQYEPGSTMKIFSFMAAMENGVYNGEEMYKSGEVKIGEDTVTDFNKKGWGTISFDKGFAYSSNTAATYLAQKIGKQKLKDYYKKLGFGAKTEIELPGENAGKINFNYDIEVATASFGQGITTTPIQNIQALTAIANDGVMIKPYIVDKIVDDKGNITYQGKREEIETVASKKTIDKMKTLMTDVVYSGLTDAKFFQPANVKIMGKTGTAEIAAPHGGYMQGEFDYIRSFAGLFPQENPKYIIYFSVKQFVGPYKAIATKIANVIDGIAKKDDNINENISHLDDTKIITLGSYLNKKLDASLEEINKLGLIPIVIGNGDIIVDQYPKKNTKLPIGNKIFLITNKKEYTMPNVIGWSTNEIITYCNLIGLKYTLNGYGKVINVSIPPNTKIDLTQVLNIELENK